MGYSELKMENLFYKWEDLNQDILLLIAQMSKEQWTPDYIVGIKRGGLIPAVKLSYILYKPLLVLTCQLRDNLFGLEFEFLEIEKISRDSKVLIVDDICDSGETFEKTCEELKKNGFNHLKTCSLFHNIRQKFLTDYRARKIDRDKDKRWIVFPWEL